MLVSGRVSPALILVDFLGFFTAHLHLNTNHPPSCANNRKDHPLHDNCTPEHIGVIYWDSRLKSNKTQENLFIFGHL